MLRLLIPVYAASTALFLSVGIVWLYRAAEVADAISRIALPAAAKDLPDSISADQVLELLRDRRCSSIACGDGELNGTATWACWVTYEDVGLPGDASDAGATVGYLGGFLYQFQWRDRIYRRDREEQSLSFVDSDAVH